MVRNDILQTIIKAANAPTQKDKVKILKEADCTLFRQYLRYVLDPQHNFYMTKKGMPGPAIGEPTPVHYVDLPFILSKLSSREVTGKQASALMSFFLAGAGPTLRTLMNYAIDRKLPGKIGATLVNKAFPGLIYQQPYGGCKAWDATRAAKFPWETGMLLEEKADGLALFVEKNYNGQTTMHTRQGQEVTDHIWHLIDNPVRAIPRGSVGHFELMLADIPRVEANGLWNSQFQGEDAVLPSDIRLMALDLVDYDSFYAGEDKTPCDKRWMTMVSMRNAYVEQIMEPGDPLMHLPIMHRVHSLHKARKIVQEWISHGKEGGVLKIPSAPWKDTKMTSQMKMKNEFECTLRVVTVIPHSRNPKWVGAFLCESLHGERGEQIVTKVGSGLNEDPDSPLCRTDGFDRWQGEIIEVKAECVSKHNALQHPRITDVRRDKIIPDTYEEVLDAYQDSLAAGAY